MTKHTGIIAAAAVLAFAAGFGTTVLLGQSPARFDHKVRNDFFAGFAGDREAFARGMKTAAETIAENPNHAEALVWHGAGLYLMAGQAFQKGDSQKGMELYGKAFAEMDKGVQLEPKSIGVRIPRGSALLAATSMQKMDDRVRSEVKRAAEDFQVTFDMQKDSLDKIGEHPLGQLLLGLGDAYSRLGETEKAKIYFDLLEAKLPGTEWGKRAAAWKQTGKLTVQQQQCVGCHVPAKSE
jgi:tetratricopeptide (TPR) repeat protein